jgi:hypothetical protein
MKYTVNERRRDGFAIAKPCFRHDQGSSATFAQSSRIVRQTVCRLTCSRLVDIVHACRCFGIWSLWNYALGPLQYTGIWDRML